MVLPGSSPCPFPWSANEYQSRNPRAEARAEMRGAMRTKLTAKAGRGQSGGDGVSSPSTKQRDFETRRLASSGDGGEGGYAVSFGKTGDGVQGASSGPAGVLPRSLSLPLPLPPKRQCHSRTR